MYTLPMARRLTRSHPDWERLNQASNDLAIAINPQVFFWGFDENGLPTVIDEMERIATIEKIKDVIAQYLEGGRFADWINTSTLFK
jgi:hypothetical protein